MPDQAVTIEAFACMWEDQSIRLAFKRRRADGSMECAVGTGEDELPITCAELDGLIADGLASRIDALCVEG